MREYEKTYKAIRNSCTCAHVAFASVSYIADDQFSYIDQSGLINPMVEELNAQLQTYCEQNDRAHFIDLRKSVRTSWIYRSV